MTPDNDPAPARGSVGRQIADGVVRLFRENAGRGPVSARVIMDGDAVVVLLHELLTKAEQVVADGGHAAEVLALRRAMQDVLRPEFVAEVEKATGRQVTAFMSTTSASPDHSAEVFLLER